VTLTDGLGGEEETALAVEGNKSASRHSGDSMIAAATTLQQEGYCTYGPAWGTVPLDILTRVIEMKRW
jgi:hypothetical protein